jgi:hypothetical protein
MQLTMSLRWVCSRCGEYFDSVVLDERRVLVALFGMTDQVCPICFSTPENRGGADLPPEKEDEI